MGRRKTTKLMSFDTSSTNSGWAYFENGNLIESGAIDCQKEKDTVIRIEDMCIALKHILCEKKPDIVVIETPPYIRDPRTLIMLAEIVGVVKGWAIDKAEYIEYMPQQWRSFVKSEGERVPTKRNDCKVWDLSKVELLYGKTSISDDEADAILIGRARINQMSAVAEKLNNERMLLQQNIA